jgi:hypothetical protein
MPICVGLIILAAFFVSPYQVQYIRSELCDGYTNLRAPGELQLSVGLLLHFSKYYLAALAHS